MATAHKKKIHSPNDKGFIETKNDLCDMENVLILFIGSFFPRLLFIVNFLFVCECESFQLALAFYTILDHHFYDRH